MAKSTLLDIDDSVVRDEAVKWFVENFTAKFNEGQAKYKTALLDKDCSKEAGQELLDLISYFVAARIKQLEAHKLVQEVRRELYDDAVDLWDLDAKLDRVISILAPGELAVKESTNS